MPATHTEINVQTGETTVTPIQDTPEDPFVVLIDALSSAETVEQVQEAAIAAQESLQPPT